MIDPCVRIVPPNTLEPTSFNIGLDSPVSIDSLQLPFPKKTTPSVGTAPPG